MEPVKSLVIILCCIRGAMVTIHSYLDLLCRWLLAVVFLYAGIPKLFDLHGFAAVIGAYSLVPESLLYVTACFLVILEIIAAVALLFKKNFGLHLTAVLMTVFIAVLTYGIVMGLDIDCGCFAVSDPEYQAFSGLRVALVRDLFLLVPLLYLYMHAGTLKLPFKEWIK